MLRLLILLLLPPTLLVTCGSVLQGPVFGSITLSRPADAGDAVAFLRCRGGGLHGEIQTDAEDTRVGPDGRFSFVGSLTFPTTERCYIEIRHPRYLTARANLSDAPIQTLEPIALQSWDEFFAVGPTYELNPGSHRAWPESEVHRHLVDSGMWLDSFPASEQRRMARYIPDIHRIYTTANEALAGKYFNVDEMLRMTTKLEAMTAYPYPYLDYASAIQSGDAPRVQQFISGGVLRRGQGSMLYLAATKGHLAVIDVLLANDEPLNLPGCEAPLLGALATRQWPAAVKLLRAGADIDPGCDRHHRSVGDGLGEFARSGKLALLQDFIEAGVPVDLRNSQNTTALAQAVTAGQIQAVKLLLAAGANPEERAADGTPLPALAKDRGFLDVERELRLAVGGVVPGQLPTAGGGTAISLDWRLGEPQPYRVHTSFGQIQNMAADPHQPGVLWLATWGGLLRVNPATGEQRAWTMAEGLPSGIVKNLWFDPAGEFLWLATNGGLARTVLDEPERVELIDARELSSGFIGGFLPGARADQVWYWNSNGFYRLDIDNSRALHYPLPQDLIGANAIAGSSGFYASGNAYLWRVNPDRGEVEQLLDGAGLAELTRSGPAGDPQLRQLSLDSARGYLWIDSHRHGVFRYDIDSGAVDHLALTAEQLAQCARTTVTPHMQGQVKLAAGQTFAQLERCFGLIDEHNSFEVLRPRIDAGPIADAAGDIWYVADNNFHRIDAQGKETVFERKQDPLDNAQISAMAIDGKQLLVSAYRSPLAVFDLEKGEWSRDYSDSRVPDKPSAGSRRHESVDPDAPELTWGINSEGAYLMTDRRILRRWPAHLPTGILGVSRRDETTTLWIASSFGLVEFPISGSLAELLQPAESRPGSRQSR